MKRTISINPTKPQYITVTNLSYAQIDYWFGHVRMDLKLDIIFPEEHTEKEISLYCMDMWWRLAFYG